MPSLLELAQNKHARALQMERAAATDHHRAEAAEILGSALPKDVELGLQEAAASGELVARFKTALELSARRGLEGDAATMAALYAVLHEQGTRAGKWLADQARTWRADAYRAEGARAELLASYVELEQLLAATAPVEASPAGDVAQGGPGPEAGAPEAAAAEQPAEGPPEAPGERQGETS